MDGRIRVLNVDGKLRAVLVADEFLTAREARELVTDLFTMRAILMFQNVDARDSSPVLSFLSDCKQHISYIKLAELVNQALQLWLTQYAPHYHRLNEELRREPRAMDFFFDSVMVGNEHGKGALSARADYDHTVNTLRAIGFPDKEVTAILDDALSHIKQRHPPFKADYPVDADRLRYQLGKWRSASEET